MIVLTVVLMVVFGCIYSLSAVVAGTLTLRLQEASDAAPLAVCKGKFVCHAARSWYPCYISSIENAGTTA